MGQSQKNLIEEENVESTHVNTEHTENCKLNDDGSTVFVGHTKSVHSILFYDEHNRIVSGSYDKTIRIFNLELILCEGVISIFKKYVNHIIKWSDKEFLACSSDGRICSFPIVSIQDEVNFHVVVFDCHDIYSMRDFQVYEMLALQPPNFLLCCFGNKYREIAILSINRKNEGTIVKKIANQILNYQATLFLLSMSHPSGFYFNCDDQFKTVKMFDFTKNRILGVLVESFKETESIMVESMSLFENSKKEEILVTGGSLGVICFYKTNILETEQIIHPYKRISLDTLEPFDGFIYSLSIVDNRFIFIGDSEGSTNLFDLETDCFRGKKNRIHSKSILSIIPIKTHHSEEEFLLEGSFATCSVDNTVKITPFSISKEFGQKMDEKYGSSLDLNDDISFSEKRKLFDLVISDPSKISKVKNYDPIGSEKRVNRCFYDTLYFSNLQLLVGVSIYNVPCPSLYFLRFKYRRNIIKDDDWFQDLEYLTAALDAEYEHSAYSMSQLLKITDNEFFCISQSKLYPGIFPDNTNILAMIHKFSITQKDREEGEEKNVKEEFELLKETVFCSDKHDSEHRLEDRINCVQILSHDRLVGMYVRNSGLIIISISEKRIVRRITMQNEPQNDIQFHFKIRMKKSKKHEGCFYVNTTNQYVDMIDLSGGGENFKKMLRLEEPESNALSSIFSGFGSYGFFQSSKTKDEIVVINFVREMAREIYFYNISQSLSNSSEPVKELLRSVRASRIIRISGHRCRKSEFYNWNEKILLFFDTGGCVSMLDPKCLHSTNEDVVIYRSQIDKYSFQSTECLGIISVEEKSFIGFVCSFGVKNLTTFMIPWEEKGIDEDLLLVKDERERANYLVNSSFRIDEEKLILEIVCAKERKFFVLKSLVAFN